MEREQEALLADAFPMEVAGGARNLAATREPRAEQSSARHMEVAGAVSSLGVLKVQKDVQTTASPMAAADGAAMRVALEPPEGSLVYAYGTVVVRDARERVARRVRKAFPAFASPMEAAVGVST